MQNLPYLLALHSIDGLGPIRLKRLIEFFKDPKLAWYAPILDLKASQLSPTIIEKLESLRKDFEPEKYAEDIYNVGVKVLSIFDPEYPQKLAQIYDPPVVLFYKGEIKSGDENAVGVVGTRKITGYGRIVTQKFSYELAKAGLTIVSGLARGVDTVAHLAAIEAEGRTIAVLGGGLNQIFPEENTRLSEKIASGYGAVISEFPPNYPSLPGNFPSRNRIIAGLSKLVLVTEAAEDSGSLITARIALEEGRDVMAVPGPITSSLAKGPADLIKEGASLAFSPEDVLKNLGIDGNVNLKDLDKSNLSVSEKAILNCLENEAKHIDEITRQLKIPTFEVSSNLVKMEIAGLIKNLGGGNYSKII